MSNTLVLTDYSPVPAQEVSFCRALQKDIDDGKFQVIMPEMLRDDKDGKKPKVFSFGADSCRVGKYAGILYYKGRKVVIHSRFDGKDGQNHFLNYALTLVGNLPMKVLRAMDETASRGTYDLLLAQLFLSQLRDAYSVGVYREYRTFLHNDSSPRGRLDIARHIRLNPLPNGKIAYSTREYTVDNPINHLIQAAWGCLCTREGTREFAHRLVRSDPALKRPLDELGWALGPEELSRPALNRLASRVIRPITHPMHQRYEAVRRTALLILSGAGLNLFQAEGLQVGGLLIPMDKTWERVLERGVLSRVKQPVHAQEDISVLLKQNGKGMRIFQPDFLLGAAEKGGRVTADMVLDAKYRRAWEVACRTDSGKWDEGVRNDVFQVMSYMYVTSARAGGVLCPLPDRDSRYAVPQSYPICAGMKEQFHLIPLQIPSSKGLTNEAFFEQMEQYCADCARQVSDLLALCGQL